MAYELNDDENRIQNLQQRIDELEVQTFSPEVVARNESNRNTGLQTGDGAATNPYPLWMPIRDYGTLGNLTLEILLTRVDGHVAKMTLNGDTDFAFSEPPGTNKMMQFVLDVTIDGTGGYTINLPASVDPSSTSIDNSANARTVLKLQTTDGGVTYQATTAGGGSGGTVPNATQQYQHLEANAALDWIAQEALNFGANSGTTGNLNFPNNTIGLAWRNATNDGNLEIKGTLAGNLDVTRDDNTSVSMDIRSQNAVEADQRLSVTVGSGSITTADVIIDASTAKLLIGAGGSNRLTLDTTTITELTLASPSGITAQSAFNVTSTHVSDPDNTISLLMGSGTSGIGQLQSTTAFLQFIAGGATRLAIDSSVGTDITQTAFSINPVYDLFRDDTTADDDIIGTINFSANDSAAVKTVFASIFTEATDVTDGTEDSTLYLSTITSGILLPRITITPTAISHALNTDLNGNNLEGLGYEEFGEIATPATPAANNGRMYAKELAGVSNPYWLDESGTETSLLTSVTSFPITPPILDLGTVNTNQDINLSLTTGHSAKLTLSGSISITFSGYPTSGIQEEWELEIAQNATGGHVITWPSEIINPPDLDTTALSVVIVVFRTNDGGGTVRVGNTVTTTIGLLNSNNIWTGTNTWNGTSAAFNNTVSTSITSPAIFLGDVSTDEISMVGTVNTNIIPSDPNTYTLGENGTEWLSIWTASLQSSSAVSIASPQASINSAAIIFGDQFSDNITFNAQVTSAITLEELGSVPSNPDADSGRFYARDDGGGVTTPYWLQSDGTETSMIASSSGGDQWSTFAALQAVDMASFAFLNYAGFTTSTIGQGFSVSAAGFSWDLPTADQYDFAINGTSYFAVAAAGSAFNNPLSMNFNQITSVTDPTSAQDVATMNYVDVNSPVNQDSFVWLLHETTQYDEEVFVTNSKVGSNATTVGSYLEDTLYFVPIFLGKRARVTELNVHITGGFVGSYTISMGIYTNRTDGQNYPDSVIVQNTLLAADALVKTVNVIDTNLEAGLYWLAFNCTTDDMNLRFHLEGECNSVGYRQNGTTDMQPITGFIAVDTSSTLPTTAPNDMTLATSLSNGVPALYARFIANTS